MKYYLPIHLDGGNRGCEAITKGTAQILKVDRCNLIALSRDIKLDTFLGLNNLATLVPAKKSAFFFKIIRKIKNLFIQDYYKKLELSYRYQYKDFIESIPQDGVMISTGGDMMCYDDNEVIFTNEELYQKGIKTILWGCSIGEKNLTPRKMETLKHFSLIYARESLTKMTLEKHGLKNVVLFPDPAFVLNPEKIELPQIFDHGDVIGINLSNYVVGGFNLDTLFGVEIVKLLDYIFEKTTLQVLLVPHVLWEGQDDRIISNVVHNKYKHTNRISILASEKFNYCQIRYIISNCRYFIGGRTHAVISAYSTCVPTLALGYSIKSTGIAKDLGMPDWTVVDSSNIMPNSLLNSFIKLLDNSEYLSHLLENTLSSYVNKINGIKEALIK